MTTLVAATDFLRWFLFGCQVALVVMWVMIVRRADRYLVNMKTMHEEIDRNLDASTRLLQELGEEVRAGPTVH